MTAFLSRILKISSMDPDDSRKRGLLNILLLGLIVIAFLITLISVFAMSQEGSTSDDIIILFGSSLVFLALAIGLLILNRRLIGSLSAWFFSFVLLAAISFADNPEQLVDGRSIYLFTIPILIASFILFPSASFVFAGLSSAVIFILTQFAGLQVANYFGMIGFFAIALVAWLASSSMEQALRDLRILNSQLDQRVDERTRELAEALTREFAETGKNQAILEGIADGVLVFGPDEKMIVANPSVCQLLNIPRDQLINKSIDEFIATGPLTAQDGGKLLKLLTSPDKEAPSTRFVWGKRTISVTTAAVVTPVGIPIGTVAVFRDFTREAEVEQMKNTFVAIVSHELRTPLNAILAYAEMIQGGVYGEVNPKQANAAARIFSNTQRLISLVSDLLDQARLEAGKLKINIEEFPISEAVYAMHSVMEKPAKDKGLQLVIEIEPTVTKTVWGDSHRYQQILINLVNNAVKFTETGQVAVRIYQPDNDHWAIDVKDTGPGIPQDAIAYIFDTFRQVDGVTIRQHGGAGLGLSIVKRLVELMGGNIKVTSTLNQGSTFTVIMPVKPQEVNQGVKA